MTCQVVEFDCSKSDYPIPHNSLNQVVEFDCSKSDYSNHIILQTRHSTVPNQTTPYHTILQTIVSRGTRPLSLHKKRLKVGPPELCPKMRSLCADRLWKKRTFKVWCSFVTKHFRQNMFIALKTINVIWFQSFSQKTYELAVFWKREEMQNSQTH